MNLEKIRKGMQMKFMDWKMRFLDLQGISEGMTKTNINEWLDECEDIWRGGLTGVARTSGLEGANKAMKVVGKSYNYKTFAKVYEDQLLTLATKDMTEATLLRNSIARRLMKKGKWKELYSQYDSLIKTSIGKSLEDIKADFMEKSIFEEVINFPDKSGRLWLPEKYADMWARTRYGEISSDMTLTTMRDNNLDVIQISDHNTTTPICMEYEGRYFSISGKTAGLPVYMVKAPFHPNCLHTEIVVETENIESKLKENKKRDRATPKLDKKQKEYIERQKEWNLTHR